MTEQLFVKLAAEWGPWAVVAFMLWRGMRRQNEREDRLAEALRDSAAAMQELSSWLKSKI